MNCNVSRVQARNIVRRARRQRRMALRQAVLVALTVACTISTGLPVQAATFTWNNTSDVWSNATPWGGTAPAGTDPSDVLQFGGASSFTATNDIVGGGSGGAFLLNALRVSGSGLALTGTTLQFSSAGAKIDLAGSATNYLVYNNIITGTDVSFTGTGAGTMQINGNISGAGRLALTKTTGAGTLVLTGSNSHAGTTLAAGTSILAVGHANALGVGTLNIAGGTIRGYAALGPVMNDVSVTGNITAGVSGYLAGLNLGGNVNLGGAARTVTVNAGDLVFSGNVSNGGINKAGGGSMIVTSAGSYVGDTTVSGGTLAVLGSGTLGANSAGNDVTVLKGTTLRLGGPSNLGSNQVLTLDNSTATNSAPILALGPGFNAGAATIGFSNVGTGLGNIHTLALSGSTNRLLVIALDGANNFTNNVVDTTMTNTRVYLGATTSNGVFTGSTLSAGTGGNYHLGGGGGTLTIDSANVLNGANNVIVGSYDNAGRGIAGTVYLKQAQSYSGATIVGNGGTLLVNGNAGLGSTSVIQLNTGTLDLRSNGFSVDDTQYASRDVSMLNSSTINLNNFYGGSSSTTHLDSLNVGGAFVVTTNPSSSYNLQFDGNTTLSGNVTFNAAGAITTLANSIVEVGGARSITKTNTGVLALTASNGYTGNTTMSGATNSTTGVGTLLVTHTSGLSGGALFLNGSLGTSTLDLRSNGAGSNTNIAFRAGSVNLTSASTNGQFTINVSRIDGSNTNNTIVFESSPGVAANWTIGAGANPFTLNVTGLPNYYGGPLTASNIGSVLSGAGYNLGIAGNLTMTGNVVFAPSSAELDITGNISEAGGSRSLTKSGRGTLLLSGSNTYTGNTTITSGHLVVASDQALGTATTPVVMAGNSDASLLLQGNRLFNRDIQVTSTAGTQIIGGYGGSNPKEFSGNLSVNRVIQAQALLGGDVTFSGVVSGAGSITKTEAGTIYLTNSNTFSGLTVNEGSVIGLAQAAGGTPFGTGGITLNGGVLQLNGSAISSTTQLGNVIAGGRGRLQINDQVTADGNTTAVVINNLVRQANGTVRFVPGSGQLNSEEFFVVSGTSQMTNGILGPWAVVVPSSSNQAADYIQFSGSNIAAATYGGSGDINTVGGSTAVWNVNAAGTLASDQSIFAFKTNVATDLGGKTLNVGDPTAGLGGILLNGGASISNGRVRLGDVEALVYVESGQSSTISANITGKGLNGGLTKFGAGTLVLANTNSYRGNTDVNNGTLVLGTTNALFRGFSNGLQVGSTVNTEAGATLDLGGYNQEIGALTGDGTINLGSATLRTGSSSGGATTYNGQIIGDANSSFVKTGTNTLVLNNVDGRSPNSMGSVVVERGILQVNAQGASSGFATPQTAAVPSTAQIIMKGGQIQLYHNGDFSSAPQNLVFGNDMTVAYSSTVRVDRYAGAATANSIVLNRLTIGDGQILGVIGGNTYNLMYTGTTTMQGDANVNASGANLALVGAVTDAGNRGTLNRLGFSTVLFGSANNYSGGTLITGGTTIFGVLNGNSIIYNSVGNLGTGNVILEPASAIRYNAASNVSAGQLLQAYSVNGQNVRVDMQYDGAMTDLNLRAMNSGSIAFNATYMSTAYDMGLIGDGTWTLGAFGTTIYDAATLGAGASHTYNVGGAGGATFVINKANVLTGNNSLVVGGAPSQLGALPNATTGTLQLNDDQNFTGSIQIHRGATTSFAAPGNAVGNALDFRGNLAASTIDVWGDLRATGRGTFTNTNGQQVNTVRLHVGSELRLDYNNNITGLLQPTMSALSLTNKWQDDLGILLKGSALDLLGASGLQTVETIGSVTVEQGASILARANGTNGQAVLQINGNLTRNGQATLDLQVAGVNQLGVASGTGSRIMFLNAANAPAKGVVGSTTIDMVAPWIVNGTDNSFVTYDPTVGFKNVNYSVTSTTNVLNAGANNGTDIVSLSGTSTVASSGADVYALRTTVNGLTLSGSTVQIRSGGLLHSSSNLTVSAPLYFGDGVTPVEGVIYSGVTGNITLSGTVTANGLTKSGRSNLILSGSNAITGNIQLNNGTLQLNNLAAAGTASITLGGSSLTGEGGAAVQLSLRNNGNGTFSNNVILADDVSLATISVDRVSGTTTGSTLSINNLTMNASPLMAQVLNVTNAATLGSGTNNGFALQVLGNLNLLGGGNAIITALPGTAAANMTVVGDVTGSSRLIKSTGGQLDLQSTNANFSGGITLNAGTLLIRGGVGTGDVLVNGGTLRMLTNSNASYNFFTNNSNNVTVTGSSTLFWDHLGSAGATSQWGTAQTVLTLNGMANPIITWTGTSGVTGQWNGNVNSFGNVVLNTQSINVQMQGLLTGEGILSKTGNVRLTFNNTNANTFTGDLVINQGLVRMAGNSANARFAGQGADIIVNPGGGITSVRAEAFRDGAAGPSQIHHFYSTSTAPSALGIGFTTTQATINSSAILDVNNVFSEGYGTGGVLGIDTTFAQVINLGTLFNGKWYLGSTVSATYSAASLGANIDGTYRLGGGGGTLTISNAALGGTNSVVIGLANGWNMANQVTISGTNTYSGGTTVVRARDSAGNNSNATLSLQGNSALYRPLGTGAVDVYGNMRIEGAAGTAVFGNSLTASNANSYTLHPGALLLFEGNTTLSTSILAGRWGNSDAIALNGATLQFLGNAGNVASNQELIGALSYDRGAEVSLGRRTTYVELNTPTLTNLGAGTLTLIHDAGLLGVSGTSNANRFIVSGGVSMTNGMVAPNIVSRTSSQFLQYDATNGFKLVDTSVASYIISNSSTLVTPTLNNGTEILDVTSTDNQTLAANIDVWALRTDRTIQSSADLTSNTITIRSGGLIGSSTSTRRIDPNLVFADSSNNPIDAYIYASPGVLQINGTISAANIYKFGTNVLELLTDQPGFSGTWYVNQGVLSPRSTGALGSGQVVLNGGAAGGSELRINLDTGTPDNVTFSSGKITAWDNNTIRFIPNANDRNSTIAAIDLKATGTGSTPAIRFQVDSSRVNLFTGNVTAFSDYVVNVDATSFGFGASSGVVFGGLTGSNVKITKIGDGRLTLGDISSSFTGGSITVDQGTLVATSNGSLGSASTTAIIDMGGVLQINTTNFNPTATLQQREGSIERWSVDGARTGTINLGHEVSLQIDASQSGVRTINLNGGSIAGYLANDANETAVIRTLDAGTTINLLSNSFLGMNTPVMAPIFDAGKFNQDGNIFSTVPISGAVLQIKGIISGNFSLTKVGNDIVELYAANAYKDTTVAAGTLRIGTANGLPTTGLLTTTGSGLFDMNGFDQTVANLSGDQGTIYNSATTLNTLTIQSLTASTYGGNITGNISLTMAGSGELALTNTNNYRGNTTLNGGRLTVGADNSLGDADRSNLIFQGGTLRTYNSFALSSTRQVILNGLGTFFTDPGTTLTLTQAITGTNNASVLAKDGGGTLVLNSTNTYAGNTTITAGTLQITGDDGLPTGTLLTINGGRFDMNGFNQTVANIAGSGGDVYNANANGLKTLTITGLTDSTYTGAIGATGGAAITLVKNGAGTLAIGGNSAYTGNTYLNAGTLSISADANLGASPAIIWGSNTAVLQVTGTNNPTLNHALDITGTSGIIDVTDAANNATFTSLVSAGSNGLTKNGAGTATFNSANNSFTGLITVNGGAIATTHSNGLGTGAAAILLNNTGGVKLVGVSNFDRNITAAGSNNTFAITGTNTLYAGNLAVTGTNLNLDTAGFKLNLTASNVSGSGSITITGGSTVLVNTGTSPLTGDVNVFGTLGGNADLQSSHVMVGAGGNISPGNSIGAMHVDSLTLTGASGNNAVWTVEVANGLSAEYTALNNHLADIIHVDGLLDLSGLYDQLDIVGLNAVTFGTEPFIIASYGSLLGQFDTITGLIGSYKVDYNYKGQNLIAIVPEPSTLALVGLGLALVTLRRRRRD